MCCQRWPCWVVRTSSRWYSTTTAAVYTVHCTAAGQSWSTCGDWRNLSFLTSFLRARCSVGQFTIIIHSEYTGWHIKKWNISFHHLQRVSHTHTDNFYNISRVSKTLVLWSRSFRNCLIAHSVKSVRLWRQTRTMLNRRVLSSKRKSEQMAAGVHSGALSQCSSRHNGDLDCRQLSA